MGSEVREAGEVVHGCGVQRTGGIPERRSDEAVLCPTMFTCWLRSRRSARCRGGWATSWVGVGFVWRRRSDPMRNLGRGRTSHPRSAAKRNRPPIHPEPRVRGPALGPAEELVIVSDTGRWRKSTVRVGHPVTVALGGYSLQSPRSSRRFLALRSLAFPICRECH